MRQGDLKEIYEHTRHAHQDVTGASGISEEGSSFGVCVLLGYRAMRRTSEEAMCNLLRMPGCCHPKTDTIGCGGQETHTPYPAIFYVWYFLTYALVLHEMQLNFKRLNAVQPS